MSALLDFLLALLLALVGIAGPVIWLIMSLVAAYSVEERFGPLLGVVIFATLVVGVPFGLFFAFAVGAP